MREINDNMKKLGEALAYKKQLAKNLVNKPLYLCDPEKFNVCSGRLDKGWCGVECFCTTDKQFAKDPTHPLTYTEYMREAKKRRQKKDV